MNLAQGKPFTIEQKEVFVRPLVVAGVLGHSVKGEA